MSRLNHRRHWVSAIAVGLLAGLLALSAGSTRAESMDLEKILAALDSADPRERREQTLQLLADNSLELETIAQLLARARSHEQRHRLLGVAQHHVLRQRREHVFDRPDRGSLGISHRTVAAEDLPDTPDHNGPAIEIVVTLPGFPAHGQLVAGDRVIAIDGEPLPPDFTADHFRELIVNYRSGEKLHVTIDRDGQRLDRTIELASAQALGAMYDPNRLQLRPQFERDWQTAKGNLQIGESTEPESGPLQLRGAEISLD
ncbi:hypothetical protein ACERK3_08975 [Phycisphaerales bacterium AB-hyl4]|uniref:PDZ domain-containing protein n=1 Tax=Natronomicrosphaera hydrolytica TaxID=3242702 RepID=A0ABV4U658_9BACT